jgi:hypothetical protein
MLAAALLQHHHLLCLHCWRCLALLQLEHPLPLHLLLLLLLTLLPRLLLPLPLLLLLQLLLLLPQAWHPQVLCLPPWLLLLTLLPVAPLFEVPLPQTGPSTARCGLETLTAAGQVAGGRKLPMYPPLHGRLPTPLYS